MQGKKRRPSAATVLSLLALFVSLGGVSYAATTIGSKQIKNNSVASKDIKNSTILTKDLASKTRSALSGARGATGPAGPTGPPGRSALSSLASGERIYGTFGLQGQGPNLWTGVTFPVPAPAPVDSRHVVIAGNDTLTGDGCTGSTVDPVSAPGYVCIYPHLSVNTTSGYGWGVRCGCGDATATGDGSRFGFTVQANGPAGTLLTANGVWVYTAP
jgi:hypothetical protein